MSTVFRGPILVVAGCITVADLVVLSQRRDPDIVGEHPKWELPGGKIEFGEMPEEALQREIAEELDLFQVAIKMTVLYNFAMEVIHGKNSEFH